MKAQYENGSDTRKEAILLLNDITQYCGPLSLTNILRSDIHKMKNYYVNIACILTEEVFKPWIIEGFNI